MTPVCSCRSGQSTGSKTRARETSGRRTAKAATAVTIEHDPGGDEGRYLAALRRAGVAVDELRYAAPDRACAMRIRAGRQLLAELGAALSTHPRDDLP